MKDFHAEAMKALLTWEGQGGLCGPATLTSVIADTMKVEVTKAVEDAVARERVRIADNAEQAGFCDASVSRQVAKWIREGAKLL